MPTTTARYPFETRALSWAEEFARGLAGTRVGFLVALREDRTIRRVYVSPPGEPFEGERKQRVAEGYRSWLVYSPYDAPGTGYLEWLSLPRPVAERWLGPLDPADFVASRPGGPASRDGWPESWRVLVG
jgi:hypothetical protein